MTFEFVVALSGADVYGPFNDYDAARNFLKEKGLEKKVYHLFSPLPSELTVVVEGRRRTVRISRRPKLKDVSEFPKISR